MITAQNGNGESLPRLPGKPLGIVNRGSLAVAILEDGSVFVYIENQNILWKGQGPAVVGAQVRLIFE